MSQPTPSASDGASGGAGDLAGQAQEKAAAAASQAQEKAQQAAGQLQDRLREQIDERASAAAQRITEQADDLRTVGSTLREEGKEGPAQVAERLAGYAEQAGGYLQSHNADGLLADAEDLGRRQPWALAAAGLAAGFAASRFLKASSRRRYRARTEGGPARLTTARPAGVYAGPDAAAPAVTPSGADAWPPAPAEPPAASPAGAGTGAVV